MSRYQRNAGQREYIGDATPVVPRDDIQKHEPCPRTAVPDSDSRETQIARRVGLHLANKRFDTARASLESGIDQLTRPPTIRDLIGPYSFADQVVEQLSGMTIHSVTDMTRITRSDLLGCHGIGSHMCSRFESELAQRGLLLASS